MNEFFSLPTSILMSFLSNKLKIKMTIILHFINTAYILHIL